MFGGGSEADDRRAFEKRYADRSGMTWEHGYELGIFPAIPCTCGQEGCEGWRRRYADDDRIGDPYVPAIEPLGAAAIGRAIERGQAVNERAKAAGFPPRPPLANFRTQSGEPMEMGAVVRIDERNGDEALRLLHDAYHALGRGYHDEGQWYGSTYQAIADFLYPDVVDVESGPPALDA